jgi:hypothetical protein
MLYAVILDGNKISLSIDIYWHPVHKDYGNDTLYTLESYT